MLQTLCIASNNAHKIQEIKAILNDGFRVLSLTDIGCHEELPETQSTIEGNSLQKAQYVYDKYHVPCSADDTGLEVDALNGEPGVFSARYAGEHKNSDDNIDLLLKKLATQASRKARFRTVVTLVGLEDHPINFEGIVKGEIIAERRGTSGFGYDPIFIPEGYERTFAEMTIQEKSQLSHRALAIKKLEQFLSHRAASL